MSPTEATPRLATDRLTALYGKFAAVKNVSLTFANNGERPDRPVGLRQVHLPPHHQPDARADRAGAGSPGRVLLDGEDVYSRKVSVMRLRRRVGMVFQRPTPFPTMSIYDNVAAGLRLNGKLPKGELDEVVERALKQAALWDEVKDRLKASAMALSGGQQQRLCIARTIAPEPEVILLDEPTASLDPQGTQRIEELVFELKQRLHHRDRDPQHAAGGAGLGHHRVLLSRRDGGDRADRQIFTAPDERADRSLHHGEVRMSAIATGDRPCRA